MILIMRSSYGSSTFYSYTGYIETYILYDFEIACDRKEELYNIGYSRSMLPQYPKY